MNRHGHAQTWIIVALAAASLLTSALVTLSFLKRRGAAGEVAGPGDAPVPGVAVWYALPEFALTDDKGQPFTRADLAGGRVSIVNFIFTRCQGPCPRMTSAMAGLQAQLRETPMWPRLQLVSVSVDPEYDTPPVLAQYAGWAHAEAGKWRFVTGSRAAVWDLIVEGFKLPVGEAVDNPDEPIYHSQKFVLVDGQGRVRGAYDGLEPEGVAAMLRDVQTLMGE